MPKATDRIVVARMAAAHAQQGALLGGSQGGRGGGGGIGVSSGCAAGDNHPFLGGWGQACRGRRVGDAKGADDLLSAASGAVQPRVMRLGLGGH